MPGQGIQTRPAARRPARAATAKSLRNANDPQRFQGCLPPGACIEGPADDSRRHLCPGGLQRMDAIGVGLLRRRGHGIPHPDPRCDEQQDHGALGRPQDASAGIDAARELRRRNGKLDGVAHDQVQQRRERQQQPVTRIESTLQQRHAAKASASTARSTMPSARRWPPAMQHSTGFELVQRDEPDRALVPQCRHHRHGQCERAATSASAFMCGTCSAA